MPDTRLFKPLKIGSVDLKHRIVMSPLTRFRADDEAVPLPFVAEYYAQRASVAGTLLITEGVYISKRHGGFPNAPGIYNDAQIDAWKRVTSAVHEKGSYIFAQLWALGRASVNKDFAGNNSMPVFSSSAVPLEDGSRVPEALTVEQIREVVGEYVQAARNAIKAGFDGIEVHGANGYLVDQFIQDTCNKRTDAYGGSIENRSRFAIEVVQAIVEAIGAERTAIRLSPWTSYQGMRMKDPIPQFSDLITKLDQFGLAYLHVVEVRISGNAEAIPDPSESLDFVYKSFTGPILVAGGFNPDLARKLVNEDRKDRDVAVVFGRYFISTPDIVFRIQNGLELNEYDRSSFYMPKTRIGYTDYPFSPEFLASQA